MFKRGNKVFFLIFTSKVKCFSNKFASHNLIRNVCCYIHETLIQPFEKMKTFIGSGHVDDTHYTRFTETIIENFLISSHKFVYLMICV